MPKLIIVAGPTAVGKTAYAVRLAQQLGTEIVSCDSRQFYHEMRIGVARPSDEDLSQAVHHFIACRSITEPYNIYDYEHDALSVIHRLMESHEAVVAVGGSGLYISALMHGVAQLPTPSAETRARLQSLPLEEKRAQLRLLDPDYYAQVDLRNPVRLQRALEVCLTAGRPYSQLLAEQQRVKRDFDVEMRVLELPREELRMRINQRVDCMMAEGLLDEVRSLSPYRGLQLNTLRTVGYTELFDFLDGKTTFENAIEAIKLHTWQYARKQLTWLRRYAPARQ